MTFTTNETRSIFQSQMILTNLIMNSPNNKSPRTSSSPFQHVATLWAARTSCMKLNKKFFTKKSARAYVESNFIYERSHLGLQQLWRKKSTVEATLYLISLGWLRKLWQKQARIKVLVMKCALDAIVVSLSLRRLSFALWQFRCSPMYGQVERSALLLDFFEKCFS